MWRMRAMAICVALFGVCLLASGDDVGVPTRPSDQDYPVHQGVKNAIIAAAIVPPDQVKTMFTSEIAKKYIVVEVAIYPQNGAAFDVEPFDFSLRVGERTSHTEIPRAGEPWPGNPPPALRPPTQVTTEDGVSVSRTTDPYGRRITTVGTYTGVSVTNGNPPPPPPPPSSGPDPYLIDRRLRDKALGGGLTRTAVAGYLYFPQSVKKRKSDTVELRYSNDDGAVGMPFPK
ncbi:MAG TPA: hypothetical protein VLY24_01395 [Bryobacteraceae bacterium]|nr:hypothetical protein [Bryobacteraceae bacterium]